MVLGQTTGLGDVVLLGTIRLKNGRPRLLAGGTPGFVTKHHVNQGGIGTESILRSLFRDGRSMPIAVAYDDPREHCDDRHY